MIPRTDKNICIDYMYGETPAEHEVISPIFGIAVPIPRAAEIMADPEHTCSHA
jgi:hypothetical protein